MGRPENGQQVPDIELAVLDRGSVTLGELVAGSWSIVMLYRDEECPLCANYFDTVRRLRAEIVADGVQLVAISTETEDAVRSIRARHELWFPLAHGASLAYADELGAYANHERGCFEPAFFVVGPDGMLAHISIQSGPAARPPMGELLALIARKRRRT